MEISKSLNINSDYRDRRAPVNWDMLLFAEVVFLDKTNDLVKPNLYQLKDTAIMQNPPLVIDSSAINFSRDAFVLLGDVVAIDKKKKHVLLSNRNTVAYTYLVIVSGSKPMISHEIEFGPGLQALVDALRVKSKVPTTFSSNKQHAPAASKNQHSPTEDNPQIEKVVHPHIASAGAKAIATDLNAAHKRLYEVHI